MKIRPIFSFDLNNERDQETVQLMQKTNELVGHWMFPEARTILAQMVKGQEFSEPSLDAVYDGFNWAFHTMREIVVTQGSAWDKDLLLQYDRMIRDTRLCLAVLGSLYWDINGYNRIAEDVNHA